MPARRRARAAVLSASAALAAFALAGTSSAATGAAAAELNGTWAPFNRCPVDAAGMLAATGQETIAQCVVSHASSGSIKLGNTTVTTGASDLQMGVIQRTGQTPLLVPPPEGTIIADSADVPGGLLGLMCPSDIPVISSICAQVKDGDLNRITATIESAGSPSDFNLAAAITPGDPILSLPVRIRLKNPFLSSDCTIGTAEHPVVLRPRTLTKPSVKVVRFDADGTPSTTGALTSFQLSGADQGDSTFAVPGASNCGLLGLIDLAVNLKTGLPAASGTNSLTLTSTSTATASLTNSFAAYPNQGRTLSDAWHSAVK
ncbi:hypothetical protein [Streptomyces sp. VRA16 Mangrove soil]|uniref:hypothetical protein n=1 Tax=Streptomyces sp. VRA16 Mangrove soil TaxID=2817434 RepID=UPI001A9FD0E5|nr:hypothetical protein [Streptomyces sp. VRA16 Mangrove soil]MBO1333117.1 hypothetical protein [Streptomyces sp. VRA16 Mangrove soil]